MESGGLSPPSSTLFASMLLSLAFSLYDSIKGNIIFLYYIRRTTKMQNASLPTYFYLNDSKFKLYHLALL